MERQSSFGSQGSAKSSATKLIKDAEKHGESVEGQNANNGFTTALFGVLFTLAKEKYSDSWKVAVLTVIVDFLLIMAIMFNLEYPWAVDPHNGIFRFFYMIEIHKPLAATGYKFYVIVFYLLSAMLFLSVAICVWVAWCFKNDNFPFLWPIKFVRVVASLFFGMLYIAALNIFLVIMECAPDHGVWKQHVWHVECLTMPHLIHVIVSFMSSITFAVAALLLVIADHELQPMSRSLLAAPHSMCELKAQLAKTVITVVDVLLWGFPKVQGVVFAICTCSTLYFHMKQLPYYTSWMNSFRLCFFAVHAWVGVHLGVLVFLVDAKKGKKGKLGFMKWEIEDYDIAKTITDSMLYGMPVVFLAAGLAGAVRLYYFFRVALKFQILQQQPGLYSKRVYRFSDDKDVEICSRIARVWDEDGNLDQQAVDLAETILRAGIQQFPKSPYLHIVYANLLIDCRQQLQSGWAQLEEARRMPLNLSYRFSIFTREQEHKQKAAVSSSGESAADLVSYVEFQRNYRMIQSYHKAALVAMREFWRLLLYDAVNLNSLTSAFRKIEQMERLADKTYKTVLERYPKAVKLLRSYALFLETVKNDPWTAAQFYSEAEKQEEALENAEHDLAGEQGLNMRNSAIITINAMGIIQMANKHAIKMLGYNKAELEGKNVSCIMPQPFSSRHNTYMRNYITTGKAKILDSLREVVALHRDRYVFPIKILVTKSQGTGADAIFMGLLKEVEPDPHQIKAWLMQNGVTLCVDQSFTDYAGWAPNDLIGKQFSSLSVDPVAIEKLLEKALKCSEEELAEGHVQADVLLLHKYAEEVPVTVRVEMGGTSDQRLIVLVMTRCSEVVPTMVFDHHGRVLFANQALCSLLGTKPKDMRGRDIGTLLPQPFGYQHHRWIKEAEISLMKPPVSSCRAGAIHSLVSSNGVHVPVRMVITSREISGVHMNIVRATRVTIDEALDEQRLNIITDQHGHVISVSAAHHATHSLQGAQPPPPSSSPLDAAAATAPAAASRPQVFGFPPENLVGRKLYDAIDIFQEWHGQGHSVMHAVKALALHSSTQPGSAWRVGVVPQYLSLETERAAARLLRHGEGDGQADDLRDGAGHGAGAPPLRLLSHRRSIKRSSTLLRNSLVQWRAAIMQVMGPEHTATGTHYTVKLWRPELLSGVLELNERMMVVKADSAAGLIFGVPCNTMSQQPLSRFLKLGPPGGVSAKYSSLGELEAGSTAAGGGGATTATAEPLISKESLLGMKHVKGGMKGKNAHKTGPRRVFEARHADGMPLQISFQVALKNGTSNTRLMAAIKPLNLIKGNVAVLYAAMRGEDLDHFTIEDATSMRRTRTLNSLHAHNHAGAWGAPGTTGGGGALLPPSAGGAVRRQGTSRLTSQAAAAAAAPTFHSAAAAGVAPGMASARTLNTVGPGGSSRGTRGGDVAGEGSRRKRPDVGGDGRDAMVPGDPLATHRTDASGLVTARNVSLDLATTPRPGANAAAAAAATVNQAGGLQPEAPAAPTPPAGADAMRTSAASPLGAESAARRTDSRSGSASGALRPPISDDSAMLRPLTTDRGITPSQRGRQLRPRTQDEGVQDGEEAPLHPHHHHHHHHHRHLSRRFLTGDWDHVLHIDPDEVPIPHDAEYDIEQHVGSEKDMTVSSSSSSHDDDGSDSETESDQHLGKNTEGAADKMTREEALQRKKTMAALEPSERVQYVKGVRRVKEWLASSYYFDRRDAEPVDSAVHRGLMSTGADPWAGMVRQQSRAEEELPAASRSSQRHHQHRAASADAGGGGGGAAGQGAAAQDGDGLDPDDQLVTLDELAAEVEQQEEGGDDDEGDGGQGDGDEGQSGRGDGRGGGSARGSKRGGGGRIGWDPGRSYMATDGGGTAHHSKGDASSGVDQGGGGGGNAGMSRGRRLKRLLKLLSGQKVTHGTSRLRLHILIVVGLMLLVHAVCFIILIIYINKQKAFITEISAAGEAIDRSHYNAMYIRAIEAAARGAGFSNTDIPSLQARLTEDVDRLEYLHQGLYLGFDNLRRSTSKKLNDLWDLPQWNVTEYKDTKIPSSTNTMMTLWNLGNDFIAAVREVAFYAANNKLLITAGAANASTYDTTTAATASSPLPVASGSSTGASAINVTLTNNRFWLFVRANVGEGLYLGYLRVLNTLLLLAQDNISMLKVVLVTLLLAEGCLVCFAAIGYVFWLLWKATRARAALFTVFLVIPQGQLKTLASRHITTAQGDDDSDEESGDKRRQDNGDRGGGGDKADDGASDYASVISAGGGAAKRSYTSISPEKSGYSGATAGTRKGITFKTTNDKKRGKQPDTVLTRLKRAISGEVVIPPVESSGRTRRFPTRKRLTHTTSDIKNLAWPFFVWGLLIVVIYLVSYLQFAGVESSLVDLKMFERSNAQASRTMYYVNELALEANKTLQDDLRPIVREEATWLDTVYSTTLYGGRTLEDGLVDGAHDTNTGSLFTKQRHASLLFEVKGCFRDSVSTCLADGDKFYQVSRHAIDPMMRRLMQEAQLLGLDDLADINHNSNRWQYVWQVARVDLHEGLVDLVVSYRGDALAAFTAQGTLHTVVFAISWVLWALYLWLLLRPYLQVSSTETKRVAEMLSQLPTELDVEGMVEESWQVVADTELDKSKLSVWEHKNYSVASLAFSVISAVQLASLAAARRFGTGGGSPRLAADGADAAAVAGATADDSASATAGRYGMTGANGSMSDGGGSMLSDKIKAAIKAAGAAAAAGDDLDDGAGSGKGAADVKGRSGALEAAPQVSVYGSSLYGNPGDAKAASAAAARKGLSRNKVSPVDSAEVIGRPGTGSDLAAGPGRPGSAPEDTDRRGGGRASNKVVPTNGGSDDEPDGRPLSPLLAFPMPLLMAQEEGGGGGEGGAGGTGGGFTAPQAQSTPRPSVGQAGSRPCSPFHYNKVVPMLRNNTRYWTEEHEWRMPQGAVAAAAAAAAAAPADARRTDSARRTSADDSGPRAAPPPRGGGGSGDSAMAAAVVASMPAAAAATAAVDPDQTVLPGEVQASAPPPAAALASGVRSGSLASGGSRGGTTSHLLVPAPPPPPPLLTDAAPMSPSAAERERERLAARTSRPGSPAAAAAVSVGVGGALAGVAPLSPAVVRTPTSPAGKGAGAGVLGAVGHRLSLDRVSRAMSPVGTPSRLSSPQLPASLTAAAAVGGGGGSAGLGSRRSSADVGGGGGSSSSRPATRLAGPAASIDLPAPPVFNRTGSLQAASSPPGRAPSKTTSTATNQPPATGDGKPPSSPPGPTPAAPGDAVPPASPPPASTAAASGVAVAPVPEDSA